jgi:predicted GNAT family N-acyltransferase
MNAMLQYARSHHPTLLPKLNSQTQALGFYAKSGWRQYGPEFDDAGIPHVAMILVPETAAEVAVLAAAADGSLPEDARLLLHR